VRVLVNTRGLVFVGGIGVWVLVSAGRTCVSIGSSVAAGTSQAEKRSIGHIQASIRMRVFMFPSFTVYSTFYRRMPFCALRMEKRKITDRRGLGDRVGILKIASIPPTAFTR
jgi:hypothetical protein